MNKNDQQFMAQKIRMQYVEKESCELDALRALDTKVKRPASIFAYTFGSIGAVIMGTGMSLVMTELGAILGMESAMIPGIVIGVIGLAMALATYPIFKRILAKSRKKHAKEILELSDKIINH